VSSVSDWRVITAARKKTNQRIQQTRKKDAAGTHLGRNGIVIYHYAIQDEQP
jgi:hypothetical protein